MASITNTTASLTGWGSLFAPSGRFSLEANKVFNKYHELYAVANSSGGTMYAGNIVAVLQDWTGNASTPTSTDETTFKTYKKGIYYVASYGTGAEIIYVGNSTEYYTKTEIDTKISQIYRFKGTKANYSELPSKDDTNINNRPAVGDVWNVTNAVTLESAVYPAGTNWAWDGNKWDALGGDVSNYLTKPTVQGTLNQILTITDANGNYAWKDAPISTSVAVGATVAEVGGYTVAVPTTKQDKVRTIKQSDDKQVDVYSKDIIDAVIAAIKTETSDLYWNSIP